MTQGAVDTDTPATNSDRLRVAANAATSASRKAADVGHQLTRFAALISAHADADRLTSQQVLNLRTEAEASLAAVFRVVLDAEAAQDAIRGLVADTEPT